MLAFFEVKCSCNLFSMYSTFMINAIHFLFCHPDAQLNCWGGISCGYKEKGAGKTDRRKCLSWLRKFHNWKPFLKSESHSKDSWLSWEGRKGRERWSKWLCLFPSTEGTGAKQVLWHSGDCSSPHCAVTMSVSWILLCPCPHSQTFCPMLMSDMLNSILIIIFASNVSGKPFPSMSWSQLSHIVKSGILSEWAALGSNLIQYPLSKYFWNMIVLKEYFITICAAYSKTLLLLPRAVILKM